MIFSQVSSRVAHAFFYNYEHLGNCGLGVWHWGAVDAGGLVGVVSFGTPGFAPSRGPVSAVANLFDLPVYQLCRGGTIHTAPTNTPSRILSGAMRELRSARGDCVIVAYSDRMYNEVGTIYQACNAFYTGLTEPKNQSNYIINGKLMNPWVVRRKFGTRAMQELRRIDPHVVKKPLTRKYRYVFVQASSRVKAKISKRLEAYILPYPRRQDENIRPMVIAEMVRARTQIHHPLQIPTDRSRLLWTNLV
jgi:hypothetical protein